MSSILIIARRELSGLFVSLTAYIVLALFLFFMGLIFSLPQLHIFGSGELIELRQFTYFMRVALFIVVPLLTMSTFSDEYRTGRIEILRTSPITEFQLLMGKFLGTMAFYLVMMASTLIFLAILMSFGRPDYGQVFSCYLGMILMGSMFVAMGLFYSSITKEPIVAALLSFLTFLILGVADYLAPNMPTSFNIFKWAVPLRETVEYLTVGTHIGDFTRGSLELSSTMYFVGFSTLFLFWTYIVLESKKWR